MGRWRLTVRNVATGETATVVSTASDPDDACCLDVVDGIPEEWGDAEIEVVSVDEPA